MDDLIRQVQVTLGSVAVAEVPPPSPGPGEVGVDLSIAGVCGSDLHAVAGHHPFLPPPYLPGHEVVGVVRELGEGVTGVAIGDRVTVEPTLPCGDCKMCRTGRSNICEHLRFFGCGHTQGGMADRFTVPVARLHRIPDDFTDLQAALIEPLATPVHAERLSGGVRDKAVVVIGAGTIGLLMLAAVRHAGARQVVVTDVLADKRDRARRLGADAVVDGASSEAVARIRSELGESADVVFDCVAVQETMDQAAALATKGGTIMVVGVPARPVTVPLPAVQDRQMRIQGSATYLAEDYVRAMEILRDGGVDPSELITARFPLARAAEAFAAAASGEHVKVAVVP